MNRQQPVWALLFSVLLIAVSGCGGGGGGGASTATVSGTVVYNSQPEVSVAVELVSATTGAVTYTAVTNASGGYTITGVAPGNYYAQYTRTDSIAPYTSITYYVPGYQMAKAVTLNGANTFDFNNDALPGLPE